MQEAENDEKNRANSVLTAVATHTRSIGIIHPPPDIRNIVDRTASFVAKNGHEFEKRILLSQAGNPKFHFLNCSDPYHAYYQHRLSALQNLPDISGTQSAHSVVNGYDIVDKHDHLAEFRPVRKVLEPPEAEQYTVCLLEEEINGEELDLIKLTAQFVARNGKQFLTGLTSRENNNSQFYFLKPTHTLFMFFTSLVGIYSKVLMPPKGLTEKLEKSVTDKTTIRERCLHRLEWEHYQDEARQKVEDEIEQERSKMATIDWHNFVVVETIDFADDDEDGYLPSPMTLEEVIKRCKISAVEEEEIVEMEMDEEEVSLVEEGMKAATLQENEEERNNDSKITPEEQDSPMRIIKKWTRPEDRIPAVRDPTKCISPITGELIPIHEMSEHMRISLIDPKYKEEKERMFAKLRQTTLAQDDEISRNIIGLARTRPDIFGTTEEEISNAVKAEIENKKDEQPKQVIWDGHMPSNTVQYSKSSGLMPPPSRPPSSIMVSQLHPSPPPTHMSYGQQPYMMNQPPMHGSQFTPHRGMPMVTLPLMSLKMPPPPLHEEACLPLLDEPEPKRQRLDDILLIPEDQFLARHPGPVRIAVSVPNIEGNLKEQVLEITVESLSETVGSLKEKIAGDIQLPANKQKLSGKPGFLKDNFSLAYYNIAGGDSIALSLRERGGRKR